MSHNESNAPEFPQFSLLPWELRNLIWEFAAAAPSKHLWPMPTGSTADKPFARIAAANRRPPALALACRHSADAVLHEADRWHAEHSRRFPRRQRPACAAYGRDRWFSPDAGPAFIANSYGAWADGVLEAPGLNLALEIIVQDNAAMKAYEHALRWVTSWQGKPLSRLERFSTVLVPPVLVDGSWGGRGFIRELFRGDAVLVVPYDDVAASERLVGVLAKYHASQVVREALEIFQSLSRVSCFHVGGRRISLRAATVRPFLRTSLWKHLTQWTPQTGVLPVVDRIMDGDDVPWKDTWIQNIEVRTVHVFVHVED
jgi:hypothetical protein